MPDISLTFAYNFAFEGDDRYIKSGWDLFENTIIQEVIYNITDTPIIAYHKKFDTIVPLINQKEHIIFGVKMVLSHSNLLSTIQQGASLKCLKEPQQSLLT